CRGNRRPDILQLSREPVDRTTRPEPGAAQVPENPDQRRGYLVGGDVTRTFGVGREEVWNFRLVARDDRGFGAENLRGEDRREVILFRAAALPHHGESVPRGEGTNQEVRPAEHFRKG